MTKKGQTYCSSPYSCQECGHEAGRCSCRSLLSIRNGHKASLGNVSPQPPTPTVLSLQGPGDMLCRPSQPSYSLYVEEKKKLPARQSTMTNSCLSVTQISASFLQLASKCGKHPEQTYVVTAPDMPWVSSLIKLSLVNDRYPHTLP